ncbi:MAG: hypothetical protein ABEJ24_03100 [Candidatus Magasanikbacteria bacterium]
MQVLSKVKYLITLFVLSFLVIPSFVVATDADVANKIGQASFGDTETFLDFEDANRTIGNQFWDSHWVKFSTPQGEVIRISPYNRQNNVDTASGKYSIAANNKYPITSENKPLVITFKKPVDKVGFNLGNGKVNLANITLIDSSGNVVDRLSEGNIGINTTHFVGIRSDEPFKKIKINYGNTPVTEEIDNLQFRVASKVKNKKTTPHEQIDLTLNLSTQKDKFSQGDHLYTTSQSYLDDKFGRLEFAGTVDHELNLNVEGSHDLSQNLGLIAISPSNSYSKDNKSELLNKVTNNWQSYLNNSNYKTEWIGQGYRGKMKVDLNQYAGKNVILAAITSNNDGYSQIKGLPTEVDDIAGVYVEVTPDKSNNRKSTKVTFQELKDLGPKIADFEQLGKSDWKKSKTDLDKNAYRFLIEGKGLPVIPTNSGDIYSRNYSLFLDGLATKSSNNVPLVLKALSAKAVGFMLGNDSDQSFPIEIKVSYESGDKVDTFKKKLEPNKSNQFFGVKSRYKLIDKVSIDYRDTSVSEEIDYLMYDDDFKQAPSGVYCITDGMNKQREFYDEQRAWNYYLNKNSWSATIEYDHCSWAYSSKNNGKYKPFCAVTDSGRYKTNNLDEAVSKVKKDNGYIVQFPLRAGFCTETLNKSTSNNLKQTTTEDNNQQNTNSSNFQDIGKNSNQSEDTNQNDRSSNNSNPESDNPKVNQNSKNQTNNNSASDSGNNEIPKKGSNNKKNKPKVQNKNTIQSCPLKSGEPYTIEGTDTVWVITNRGTKRPIQSAEVYFTYFDSWDIVKKTDRFTINKCLDDIAGFVPYGPKWNPKGGALVKVPTDNKVYLLLGNNKYWINNQDIFKKLGYKWGWIQDISPELLEQYNNKGEIDYTDHHPIGSLIKYPDSNKVYRIEKGPFGSLVKRHVKDERVFNALGYRFDRVVEIDKDETYKRGQPITIKKLNKAQ